MTRIVFHNWIVHLSKSYEMNISHWFQVIWFANETI